MEVNDWLVEVNGWLLEVNGWLLEDNGWLLEDNGWLLEDNGWLVEVNGCRSQWLTRLSKSTIVGDNRIKVNGWLVEVNHWRSQWLSEKLLSALSQVNGYPKNHYRRYRKSMVIAFVDYCFIVALDNPLTFQVNKYYHWLLAITTLYYYKLLQ